MGFLRTNSRLPASLGTTKIYDRPSGTAHWVDGEIDKNVFRDARLGKRFRELLIRMGGGIGESIPLACQDWANTKAAYRFFANERVREGDILSGHFDATRARFEATRGTVLLLQDTTEFTLRCQTTAPR
jgi:Transposase DNA-binding